MVCSGDEYCPPAPCKHCGVAMLTPLERCAAISILEAWQPRSNRESSVKIFLFSTRCVFLPTLRPAPLYRSSIWYSCGKVGRHSCSEKARSSSLSPTAWTSNALLDICGGDGRAVCAQILRDAMELICSDAANCDPLATWPAMAENRIELVHGTLGSQGRLHRCCAVCIKLRLEKEVAMSRSRGFILRGRSHRSKDTCLRRVSRLSRTEYSLRSEN